MNARNRVIGWENGQPLFAQDEDAPIILEPEPPVWHRIVVGEVTSRMSRTLAEAEAAAARAGIREGETLAELIARLHDEANADE